MRGQLLLVPAVLFLWPAGCGSSGGRPPSGAVYEGKHVSQWGGQLKSPDRGERLAAAKLLLRMGKEGISTKEAIPGLGEAVSDEDPEVRGWSAVALVFAARGTPYPVGQKTEPVAALKEAAESADAELRAEATAVRETMGRRPGGRGRPGAGEPGAETGEGKEATKREIAPPPAPARDDKGTPSGGDKH